MIEMNSYKRWEASERGFSWFICQSKCNTSCI